LTNVIVTGFGESCSLVRESKMFVKMKPRFRAEWEVVVVIVVVVVFIQSCGDKTK